MSLLKCSYLFNVIPGSFLVFQVNFIIIVLNISGLEQFLPIIISIDIIDNIKIF